MGTATNEIEVSGVFLKSLAAACLNLKLIVGAEAADAQDADPAGWYTVDRFSTLFDSVGRKFRNPEPIRERIGAEMMRLWYEFGPGRTIVSSGVDFLQYQTSSEGYHSVVRGPTAATGGFTLESLEPSQGTAIVRSTTPFDRSMERGVLLGGMQLTGDLVFVDVQNQNDPSLFTIRYR